MSDKGDRRRSDPDYDTGVVLRPEMVELDDSAVIPNGNIIDPAPTHFTHELTRDEPYYFDRPDRGTEPDGSFPAGTRVVVLIPGQPQSRVADATGRYVDIPTASLRELP